MDFSKRIKRLENRLSDKDINREWRFVFSLDGRTWYTEQTVEVVGDIPRFAVRGHRLSAEELQNWDLTYNLSKCDLRGSRWQAALPSIVYALEDDGDVKGSG